MIPPITASLPPVGPATVAGPASGAAGTGGTAGAPGAGGFSTAIGNLVDSLQQAQNTASAAEANAAAGQGSLTDTMVAATEASLETQVTTSVLDRAISAYISIEQMQF